MVLALGAVAFVLVVGAADVSVGDRATLTLTSGSTSMSVLATAITGPSFDSSLSWQLVQNPVTEGSDFSGCSITDAAPRASFLFLALSTCAISDAVANAKAKGYRGIVFMDVSGNTPVVPAESVLPVLLISKQAGMGIINAQATPAAMTAAPFNPSPFDTTGLALLVFSLLSVAGSAFYGAYRERQVYARFKDGMSGFAVSGDDDDDDDDGDETNATLACTRHSSSSDHDAAVTLSTPLAAILPVMSTGTLLLLHTFTSALTWPATVLSAVFACAALFSILYHLAKALGQSACLETPGFVVAGRPIGALTLALAATAAVTAALWAGFRGSLYAWLAQDFLAVVILLAALRLLRLSSLKAASALLLVAFAADAVWAFAAPRVAVAATADAAGAGTLPVVMRLPRAISLLDPSAPGTAAACWLADVAFPALFGAYLLRHDYTSGAGALRGGFIVAFIGYLAGLLLSAGAQAALAAQQQLGQLPALLCLVPCMLLPVYAAAWARGQLRQLWAGPDGDDNDVSTVTVAVSVPARGNGSSSRSRNSRNSSRKQRNGERDTQIDTGDVEMGSLGYSAIGDSAGASGSMNIIDCDLNVDSEPLDAMHVVGLRPDEL
jgi:hypothetical protein